MLRIIYTIVLYLKYRSKIRKYLQAEQPYKSRCITDINLMTLKSFAVQGLILDFDGVLAAHGEPLPTAEVQQWLTNCCKVFKYIYILSNKPTSQRAQFFAKHFPMIKFIVAKQKKPYPAGIQQIIAHSNLSAEKLLLIDDRLLTGILCAVANQVPAWFIYKPYSNFKKRPIVESFFSFLRWFEKKL